MSPCKRPNPIALLAALLLVHSASARDFHLGLLGGAQVVADPSVDPLSGDDGLPLFTLEFGLELPELAEGLSLELAYQTGDLAADLFAGDEPWLRSSLEMHELVLGAVYRLPLTSWLSASARLGASLDFARLRIHADGQRLLSDWAKAKLGAVGLLGLELSLPRNWWRSWLNQPPLGPGDGFTIGLRLEAGWAHRQPFNYDGARAPAAGDLQPEPVPLGHVHLDGAIFRAGVFAVF